MSCEILWKNDLYLADIDLSGIRLLSCDIFDTLLYRTTLAPTDVFIDVGNEGRNRGILRKSLSGEEFKALRITAERTARREKEIATGTTEVNLPEIYSYLTPVATDVQQMMDLELFFERKHLFLNRSVASLLYYCSQNGIITVLLSDMYLSSHDLRDLISNTGFDCNLLTDIIVSNEHGTSKRKEGLYSLLLNRHPSVTPSQILHIGDSYESDVDSARAVGINAIHYDSTFEHYSFSVLELCERESVIPEMLSLRRAVANMTHHLDQEDRFWFTYGATTLGPVLSCFAEWVIATALEEGVRGIYPLMREGVLLTTMLTNVCRHRNLSGMCVKPMYTSRKASFLPSLPCVDKGILEKLLLNINTTISSALKRFKIHNPFDLHGDITILNAKNIILESGQSLYEAVQDYLLTEDAIKTINQQIGKERALLRDYLEQEGFSKERYITVDIGYGATIQAALEECMSLDGKLKGIHLLLLGSGAVTEKALRGMDIRGFVGNMGINCDLMRGDSWTPALIENLMMGKIGSTTGYIRQSDGTVVPELEGDEATQLNHLYGAKCREGVLAFQAQWLELLKDKPWMREEVLRSSSRLEWIFRRLMEHPTVEEAKYLGKIYHENEFIHGWKSTVCTPEQEELVQEIGPEEYLGRLRPNTSVWVAGNVERVYPFYMELQLLRQSPDIRIKRMAQIGRHVHVKNIKDVVVCGAGRMGESLIVMLQKMGVTVHCVTDRKKELWGKSLKGVRICSLDQAMQCDAETFVIASFAFQEEIRSAITKSCNEHGTTREIITYAMAAAATDRRTRQEMITSHQASR